MGSGRVGSVGSNSDYTAISVQLQLQLPAGTELGNWMAFDTIEINLVSELLRRH